jgi:hypothetical protein
MKESLGNAVQFYTTEGTASHQHVLQPYKLYRQTEIWAYRMDDTITVQDAVNPTVKVKLSRNKSWRLRRLIQCWASLLNADTKIRSLENFEGSHRDSNPGLPSCAPPLALNEPKTRPYLA